MNKTQLLVPIIVSFVVVACSQSNKEEDSTKFDRSAETSVSNVNLVFDVMKIAGKSRDEVDSLFGSPSDVSKSKYGQKCIYKEKNLEIVFIEGIADWITIEGFDQTPFSSQAISAIGLKAKSPSFSNDFTKRWNTFEGIREVSIFGGSHGVDYAYIKVKTN